MKNGLYISPGALRLTVGALISAVAATVVAQLPSIRRYTKMETM